MNIKIYNYNNNPLIAFEDPDTQFFDISTDLVDKFLIEKINTMDKIWAIQNLQSQQIYTKLIAMFIINNLLPTTITNISHNEIFSF